jgi:hypothetical protein
MLISITIPPRLKYNEGFSTIVISFVATLASVGRGRTTKFFDL